MFPITTMNDITGMLVYLMLWAYFFGVFMGAVYLYLQQRAAHHILNPQPCICLYHALLLQWPLQWHGGGQIRAKFKCKSCCIQVIVG